MRLPKSTESPKSRTGSTVPRKKGSVATKYAATMTATTASACGGRTRPATRNPTTAASMPHANSVSLPSPDAAHRNTTENPASPTARSTPMRNSTDTMIAAKIARSPQRAAASITSGNSR